MTRQECEQKILDKLDEIRGVLNEYDPNLEYCVIGFGAYSSYVYKLAMDCNGKPINGEYLLDAHRTIEEG